MIKSLRDVSPKVEIHKAEAFGKQSYNIPEIVSSIVGDKNSSVHKNSSVNVLVNSKQFSEIEKQVEDSKLNPNDFLLDTSLINVQKLPQENEKDVSSYSTEILKIAIIDNNEDIIKKMLDPHVISVESGYDAVLSSIRNELSTEKKITEAPEPNLKSAGGESTIRAALSANSDKLEKSKKIITSTLKPLGSGEKGIAYDTGNGVLKITTDKSEAAASYVIKGKKLSHVVRIDDVFKIPDTEPQLYGIMSEMLSELSEAEKSDTKTAFAFIREHEPSLNSIATDKWDVFVEKLYKELEKDTINETGLSQDSPGGVNKIRKITQRRHNLIVSRLKNLKIDKMVDELRNAGIQFADYHEDNLMKRGSEFVINDLGASKTAGSGEPPILEKVVDTLVKEFTGYGNSQLGIRQGQWSHGGSAFTDDETDPNRTER